LTVAETGRPVAGAAPGRNNVTLAEERSLDFCSGALYDDPWDIYAWLRSRPEALYWDDTNDLWIAAKHADVFHFSRESHLYCNRFGVRPIIAGDMSLITLDGEEHTRQRRLINKGFTPSQVRKMIPHVRELTQQLCDDLKANEDIDFVERFAIHIPLIIICEMMGLDPDVRLKMYRWSDAMMDGDGHIEPDDPVLLAAAQAFGEYAEMCIELIAARRADPSTDDLIGVLTQAFDAGQLEKPEGHNPLQGIDEPIRGEMAEQLLNDEELLGFLVILLVAGNETTRNALSGGMVALSQHPEAKRQLIDNLHDDAFVDLAVDELIRYVSPVISFIRTVTEDHEYKGHQLKQGDRILMLYQSANRDETVFDRPDELVLDRNPNPHLAFGIGPHFCLGANLARMEVKTVFQELLSRFPDIEITEQPPFDRGDSSLVLALQHLGARTGTDTGCPFHHGG
jgi:cytochrome P450 family 142 subfamily A polypeptide 1